MKKLFLVAAVVCALFESASGQDKPVAFTNAKIIPIVGQPIEQGTVVVQNGKIIAVGDSKDDEASVGRDHRRCKRQGRSCPDSSTRTATSASLEAATDRRRYSRMSASWTA